MREHLIFDQNNLRASEKVAELKGLNKVGVPNHAAILDADLREGLVDFMDLLDALIKGLLGTENADIALHSLLHSKANLGGALGAIGGADLVKNLNRLGTGISLNRLQLLARLEVVADGVGNGTAENDQVEERVGTETVSTVDRHASSLTASEQTRDNLVVTRLINSENLTGVTSGDTAHIVVDGGKDRNGLLANIDTSEDASGLRDTGQTLGKNLGRKMAELEVDVVLLGADTTTITNLHSHRPGDDVTGSKILGGGRISLHETLTLGVEEVATLTTSTLSDQATGTVDTGRMELDELEILVGETGAGNHGHAVTSASVSRSAGEVGTSVSTCGENGVGSEETVQGAVLLVVGEDTTALAILHNQINGKVLDEVVGVVAERLAVEGVKKSVTGTIGSSAAAVGLAALSELLGLTTESTLVTVRCCQLSPQISTIFHFPFSHSHLAILSSGEGAAVVLELDNGSGGLAGHVVNGVLVTEPVGALHRVVHVPSPVVLVHVAEGGVDATLGSDCVTSRWEELGNAGSVEAGLGKTESGTKTGTSRTDNDCIVLVVLQNAECQSTAAVSWKVVLGRGRTYDNRVFAAEEW